MHSDDISEPLDRRVLVLERDVGDLRATQTDQKKLRTAIVVAMLGAALTVALTAGAALVAYGRLTQQAETTERLLTEVRGDLADLRREIRAR
jgi:hypothetical protein